MNYGDKLKAKAEKARAVNEALKPLPQSKYKRKVLDTAWWNMSVTGAALDNYIEAKL